MSILNDGQEQIGQISWELPFALGVAVGAAIVIVLGWRALQDFATLSEKGSARKRQETNMPYKVEQKP